MKPLPQPAASATATKAEQADKVNGPQVQLQEEVSLKSPTGVIEAGSAQAQESGLLSEAKAVGVSDPYQDDIPEIPDELDNVHQGVENVNLAADNSSETETVNGENKHSQNASSGSEVPSLSATSTQPSEEVGLSSSSPSSNEIPAQTVQTQSSPSEEKKEEEKVFNGFGPNRPYGKIGLPTSSLGPDAPVGLKISPSPTRANEGGEEKSYSSKWGTREGGLISPGAGNGSRAVSPSASSQGESAGKKVPIWMRKGGEAS